VELDLGETDVSDAGLVHLKGLANLKELGLYRTKVTDAGVRELQLALPGLFIVSERPGIAPVTPP
jgi:hypothetical protein